MPMAPPDATAPPTLGLPVEPPSPLVSSLPPFEPEQPKSSVAAMQTGSRPKRNAPSVKPKPNFFLDEILIDDTPILQHRPNEFEWTKLGTNYRVNRRTKAASIRRRATRPRPIRSPSVQRSVEGVLLSLHPHPPLF